MSAADELAQLVGTIARAIVVDLRVHGPREWSGYTADARRSGVSDDAVALVRAELDREGVLEDARGRLHAPRRGRRP